jgi:hypothetical protein
MQEPGGDVQARLQNNLGKLVVITSNEIVRIASFARFQEPFSNHKFFPAPSGVEFACRTTWVLV